MSESEVAKHMQLEPGGDLTSASPVVKSPSSASSVSTVTADSSSLVVRADRARRVVVGGRAGVRLLSRIPADIINNAQLNAVIAELPDNYNFEIHKTLWRIRQVKARCVALQFPEGLLVFSLAIADIIEQFSGADTLIMADVTYGACCVDDFSARALGADLMVHYGHSCLVPVDRTSIKMLYVFVDIKFDAVHFLETLRFNLANDVRLALVSTVQFVATLHNVAQELRQLGYQHVTVPQVRPLSAGEVLGCTSPVLQDIDTVVYLGDGRFHLESVMIANDKLQFYRYDPYSKVFSREFYQQQRMVDTRASAIARAAEAKLFGIIFGTLGRQGNPHVLSYLQEKFSSKEGAAGRQCITLLLSEIYPDKLRLMPQVDAWIQTSCPRLSIDWGSSFDRPLLSPYEASVVVGAAAWRGLNYPMDFYSNSSLGPWTPNHRRQPQNGSGDVTPHSNQSHNSNGDVTPHSNQSHNSNGDVTSNSNQSHNSSGDVMRLNQSQGGVRDVSSPNIQSHKSGRDTTSSSGQSEVTGSKKAPKPGSCPSANFGECCQGCLRKPEAESERASVPEIM